MPTTEILECCSVKVIDASQRDIYAGVLLAMLLIIVTLWGMYCEN